MLSSCFLCLRSGSKTLYFVACPTRPVTPPPPVTENVLPWLNTIILTLEHVSLNREFDIKWNFTVRYHPYETLRWNAQHRYFLNFWPLGWIPGFRVTVEGGVQATADCIMAGWSDKLQTMAPCPVCYWPGQTQFPRAHWNLIFWTS